MSVGVQCAIEQAQSRKKQCSVFWQNIERLFFGIEHAHLQTVQLVEHVVLLRKN